MLKIRQKHDHCFTVQCWEMNICVSLEKHFVKSILCCFHRIYFKKSDMYVCTKISYTLQCTAVWKNEKLSLTEKEFRQINHLVISLVKLLLSLNFLRKKYEREFLQFPHCSSAQCGKISLVTFTKFLPKMRTVP